MPADQCLPSSSRPYIDLKIRLPSLHESLGKVEGQPSGKLAKTAQLLNETGGGGTGPRPHIAACTPEVGHCGTRWHWPGVENREIEDCRMCEAMFRFGHMRNCGKSETHTGRNTSCPKSVSNCKVNESGPSITHVDYTPAYCDPFKAERRLDNLFRIMVPGGGVEPPRYEVPADFEFCLRIARDLGTMIAFTCRAPFNSSVRNIRNRA
jgi:hypothetical protein